MDIDKLRIEVVQKNGKKSYAFRGVVDEDSVFTPVLADKGPLYLNLSGVTGINSLGIRSWVNLLKELAGREVFYVECPPVIVRQMNMVPSLVSQAKVLSVFAPYVCDNCEAEKLVLMSEEQLGKKPPTVPAAFKCESCKKGEMELDGHPQQYFAFQR